MANNSNNSNNSSSEYLFIIYSCQKNLPKAEQVYERIVNKLDKCKVYITYGATTSDSVDTLDNDYKIIDDKYIVLNCLDDYDHLSDKTLLLLNTITVHLSSLFPLLKGMFKCDDDVIVNCKHINVLINCLKENNNYCGKFVGRTEENIKQFPDKHPLLPALYCAGPLYFLSKKALECFSDRSQITKNYYEDVIVGYHLNKHNIYPEEGYNLYSDKISDSLKLSYHNSKHFDELYIVLKGGLGNQLFQLASAMQLAGMYKKKVVLNTLAISPNPHQGYNRDRTVTTLRRLFPALPITNEQIHPEHYHKFDEPTNDCFLFIESKLEECFQTYCNVVLEGYFVNPKYIPSEPESIFNKANIIPDDKSLLEVNFENTYFIHIRLGDYLNHPLYTIPLKKYYEHCINAIKHINPLARFYICTNQFDGTLQNYVKDFPKGNEYRVQAANNNDIDTLYIMSRCQGAICSNSTLSYMGAYFQKNKNKETIYMPYPFINYIKGFNQDNVSMEMYPEWCKVYDVIKNEVIKSEAVLV